MISVGFIHGRHLHSRKKVMGHVPDTGKKYKDRNQNGKNSKRYRHKPYTIGNFQIPRFASSGNSFKKQFRNNSQNKKKLNIFTGGCLKRV